MAFLLTIAVIVAGLLLSLGTSNRREQRRLAQGTRSEHRRQLEDVAVQVGLPLGGGPLGARIAGSWQGRTVALQVLSGGGVLSEAEADLELSLRLRHRLPPGSQLWRRGQPGPAHPVGHPLPGTRGVMLRAEHPRQLSALVSQPGAVSALESFLDDHHGGIIEESTIRLRRRHLDDLPHAMLHDAAKLAGVLEAVIEAPWIAAARRVGLTPRTDSALEMVGTLRDLPVHIQRLDSYAVSIFVRLRLPPGSTIRRRRRGQLGGQSTGSPIADQLLIVHGPITAALRSPECTAAAMEVIHGQPGSTVDADGVRLVAEAAGLEALPEHLDAALSLAAQIAPHHQPESACEE